MLVLFKCHSLLLCVHFNSYSAVHMKCFTVFTLADAVKQVLSFGPVRQEEHRGSRQDPPALDCCPRVPCTRTEVAKVHQLALCCAVCDACKLSNICH